MPSWGSNNSVNAAPTFVNGMCGYVKVANSFNANTGDALNAYTPADASGKSVQTGWVYTRRGTGGRAGRKNQEVLVTLAAVANTQANTYVNTGLA
ncbi:MAG: hypothetical protein EOO89_21910 [Pedobacter sp.]|nr:MAG: hypothetical protein EOO89_21910 [Pedobacter sp.]